MAGRNLWDYKTPRSAHTETGIFSIRGRIGRRTFVKRLSISFLFYCLGIWFCLGFSKFRLYDDLFFSDVFFTVVYLIIVVGFLCVQCIKRLHDANYSGWFLLLPIYNILLLFSKGTHGSNSFGIQPSSKKVIKFFDELDLNPQVKPVGVSSSIRRLVRDFSATFFGSLSHESTGRKNVFLNKIHLFFGFISFLVVFLVYQKFTTKDTDGDGVNDSLDKCINIHGNEEDGCFYHKKVIFYNKTKTTTWISLAFKNRKNWICKGWFEISSNSQYTLILPKYYDENEVFWIAQDAQGREWSGKDRFFYIEKNGNSGYEVVDSSFLKTSGGRIVKQGFYRLELNDEISHQSFRDF